MKRLGDRFRDKPPSPNKDTGAMHADEQHTTKHSGGSGGAVDERDNRMCPGVNELAVGTEKN